MSQKYSKEPITIQQQIDLLATRGLEIKDTTSASNFLQNVSYYRLGWYLRTFQDSENQFDGHVSFEHIKKIYITDQRIRTLIAEAVERIEVAIRSRIVNVTCCAYDTAFWHSDIEWIKLRLKNRKTREDSNCPLKHYDQKYQDSNNSSLIYPFWIISELLFFSDLSILFDRHVEIAHKKEIAKEFSLTYHHLASCLHVLTILRNTVAHHDKVYKRVFSVKPKFKWIGQNKNTFKKHNFFINHYLIISHMLSVIHPNNTWDKRILEVLCSEPDIAYGYGFTFDDIKQLKSNYNIV